MRIPHKISAFHSVIHFLVSLVLTNESCTAEVSTIKQLASSNNIIIDVDGLIRGKTVKALFPTTTTLLLLKFVYFLDPLPSPLTTKLGEVIKSINRISVHYSIKLGRLFPKGKDPSPPLLIQEQ